MHLLSPVGKFGGAFTIQLLSLKALMFGDGDLHLRVIVWAPVPTLACLESFTYFSHGG